MLFFLEVSICLAELRCENKWEPLLYARSRIVHAAASAGIDAIDVPYLDLEDPNGMKIEAQKAKELGFSGKGSIHPKQIPILNEVFTPTDQEIEKAKKITSTFENAQVLVSKNAPRSTTRPLFEVRVHHARARAHFLSKNSVSRRRRGGACVIHWFLPIRTKINAVNPGHKYEA